jgi:transcription antitermination factor NusG
VDAALIAGLRAQEVRLQEQDSGLRRGEVVIILDGPFRELQAVYEQDDGACRAFVLIEFLHRITRVSIAQDCLRKAG